MPSSVVTDNFDSIVHQAARLGLFKRDAASQRDIESSQFIQEQAAAFREEAIVDSTENRYDSQSRFECYVQSLGSGNGGEYFAHLRKLESLIAKREQREVVSPVDFTRPSMALVDTWVRHMRNERGNKAKSIETWVGGVSATCKMYTFPSQIALLHASIYLWRKGRDTKFHGAASPSLICHLTTKRGPQKRLFRCGLSSDYLWEFNTKNRFRIG